MTPDSIPQLLDRDLANTRLLNELLVEERELLEKRQIESLNAALRRKAELLAHIEKNDALCQKLLDDAGYTADRQGLQAWCEEYDRRANAQGKTGLAVTIDSQAERFQKLQQQLHTCREMNLVNAAIVHRSKLNNVKMLDILRGKTTGSGLYNPGGSASNTSSEPRTLGSA